MHARHARRGAGRSGSPRPGSTAYNHNLDTSREYYKSIITTRTYDDRLRTLATSARPASPCARAASSAWASRSTIAARCCARWRTWTRSRRACPSTRWSRVEGTPLGRSAARRSARAGAHDRHRAHPDAAVARAPVGRAHWRSRARRSCSASSPAPTRSSTARSCSPPATRTSRPIKRCCATPGLRAAPAVANE